ncbi:MAG: DUF86 domain-containing protein [Candidatus Brocadiae bacterium]|nr:DUF86 domain-containing protein [Candidatus Brocadiia bacterium]
MPATPPALLQRRLEHLSLVCLCIPFLGNDLLRSAVLQKLTIIGEAAARLPAEFRRAHAEVEWADVVAFRNIAVHAYFAVDWSIVWVTATQDAPALRAKVAAILEEEYPD